MMRASTPTAPPADWSILSAPPNAQLQILAVLQDLVEMLTESSLAEKARDLAAKAEELLQREAALEQQGVELTLRERNLERRLAAVKQFVQGVVGDA